MGLKAVRLENQAFGGEGEGPGEYYLDFNDFLVKAIAVLYFRLAEEVYH